MKNSTPRKENSSILKAAEVMKCLSDGDDRLSIIARKMGYHKSTVHSILKALQKVGLAYQDPTNKRFYLGPLLYALSGNSLKVHRVLNEIALRHMESLRDVTQETVNLQIPMGTRRIIIDIVFMIREYMYFAKPGDTSPIYSGAAGKVLLSMFSDQDLMELLNKVSASSVGEVVDERQSLLQDIQDVRRNGYAMAFDKFSVGGGAFSVPIFNYFCPVALTIVGIEDRMKSKQEILLNELKKTSNNISKELSILDSTGTMSISKKNVFSKD